MADDPTARRTEALRTRIEHVRAGAGDRFERIELSIVPDIEITNNRADTARQMIVTKGWSGVTEADVFDMPGIFIGPIHEICAQMEARRLELGISYFIVPDQQMQELAPIVTSLKGR
jgi:hypothetical protein